MREQTVEEAARSIISEYIEDIIGYMDSSNDGMLAPWMMAKMRCHEMEDSLQAVCDAISSRPGPGQRALRAVALQDMDLEPFESPEFPQDQVDAFESILDEMEAEHISAAKPDPFFSQKGHVDGNGNIINAFASSHDPFEEALKMVRPPA